MRRSLLLVAILLGLLGGDARPGWCPFSEPSPGAGIRLPQRVSPPRPAPAPPPAARYPVFERPAEAGGRPQHSSVGAGAPMALRPGPAPHGLLPPPARWMGNPLWIASACLLFALIGVLPLLWMRWAEGRNWRPAEIESTAWQGWTRRGAARPGRTGEEQ